MMKSQHKNTTDTAPCNTRSRCWGPNTWNNHTQEDLDELITWMENECIDFVCQEECGENGTIHIQFCMKFKNARSFNSLKKNFPKAHLEQAKNWAKVKNYCRKKETAIGPTILKSSTIIRDPLKNKELYEWQKNLLLELDREPNDRTITWVCDYEGNSGKTSLAKHLCLINPSEVLYTSGKAADIKYGVFQFLKGNPSIKICIFDFVRSNENYVSFDAIESIKNGIFYNTKYESEMCIYNPPHVVCFANFYPDKEKLSLDRWNIIVLEDKTVTNE